MADDRHDGLFTRHDVPADQERDLPGLLVEKPGPIDDRYLKLPERRGLGRRIFVQVTIFANPEFYIIFQHTTTTTARAVSRPTGSSTCPTVGSRSTRITRTYRRSIPT